MISRATGVVWLILILVQNGRENKQNKKQKAKTFSADGPCPCGARASPKKLPFRDVHDVGIPASKYMYSRSR